VTAAGDGTTVDALVAEGAAVAAGPCPACGAVVLDGERYCETCGTRLGGDDGPTGDVGSDGTPGAANATRSAAHSELDLGVVAAVSDRGRRRSRNEDAVRVAGTTGRVAAVVCDGVASTANADLASAAAAGRAVEVLEAVARGADPSSDGRLVVDTAEAFAAAQEAVLPVPSGPRGHDLSPSTTMVAAVVVGTRVVVGGVGDSRVYWLSADGTAGTLLTVDDSWARERIDEGMDPEIAFAHPEAHTITRWIGADAGPVVPRIAETEVSGPGLVVLCTDGLWNYFEEPDRLARLVAASPDTSALGIARHLVDAALGAGGQDNVTVAVIPVTPVVPTPGIGPGTDQQGE